MEQLSKKERNKIYLQAAEYYDKYQGRNWWDAFYYEGFCGYAQMLKNGFSIKDYPEYQLFKNGVYYFPRYEENTYKVDNSERIIALLLCYWMTKD